MRKKGIICTILMVLAFAGGFITHAAFQEPIDDTLLRLSVLGPVRVVRVSDGDTLTVARYWGKPMSVRLIGVDTPETHMPGSPVECFGPEAHDFAKNRLDGKYVWLEFDSDRNTRDNNGRLLAYAYVYNGWPVITSTILFNVALVREGFAEEWTYPAGRKYRYQQEFLAAEMEAREALRGRWGSCGLDSKKHWQRAKRLKHI